MKMMRSRLRSLIAASGAALLTIGAGLAWADSVAVNGGATLVSSTSEMLNGVATVTDPDSAFDFQYGTTPNFGFTTGVHALTTGTTTVAATVSGLTPGQKYYFRLVVAQGSYNPKISVSDTLTFTAGSTGGGGGGGGGSASGTGSLSTSKLKVQHGSISIPISCAGPSSSTCAGKASVTTRGKLKKHGRTHTYKCGGGSFSATGGNAAVVHAKISAACKKLLARAKGHKLHGTLHVTFTTTQKPLTKSVTLSH